MPDQSRSWPSVFFIDSLREQTSAAIDHPSVDDSGIACRQLNDGRAFRVVKVFYDPLSLEHRLTELGWSGRVHSTGKFFLYGLFTKETR